jgi:hypothetical protein
MAYRLDGNDLVRLGSLPFVVTPYRLVVYPGRVCGLEVCPGEIFVAVPAVAISRDLAVRGPDAPDAPAVGGVVTHTVGKRRIVPTSSMMVRPRICPTPGTVRSLVNSFLILNFLAMRFSISSISC